MNIKQKVKIKIQQMGTHIFSNQTLQVLTNCLLLFTKMQIIMQKVIKRKYTIYQETLITTIILSSMKTNLIIMCTSPSLVEPPTKCSKRGGWTGPQILEGGW